MTNKSDISITAAVPLSGMGWQAWVIFIIMLNMITAVKKQVLIRGVDEDIYRRAKSAAALQGVSMGAAVSEALRGWVEKGRTDDEIQMEVKQDIQYVKATGVT